MSSVNDNAAGLAPMLQVNAVTQMIRAKAAVDGVSVTIDRPAFVGIIGRSGAEKSTFLRLTNRLVDATAGEILIDGRNVLALRGAEARPTACNAPGSA